MSGVYDYPGAMWLLGASRGDGPVLQAPIERMGREADSKALSRRAAPPDVPEEIGYTKRMQKLQLRAELEIIPSGKKLRDVLTHMELVELAAWCVQVRDYILLDRIVFAEKLDPTTTIVNGDTLAALLEYDPRFDEGNKRYENTRALLAGEFINTIYQHKFIALMLRMDRGVLEKWTQTPTFYTKLVKDYIKGVQDRKKAEAGARSS